MHIYLYMREVTLILNIGITAVNAMIVYGAVARNLENPPSGVKILQNATGNSIENSNFSIENKPDIFYEFEGKIYTKKEFALEINASLTLLIGIMQIAMGFCRLGFVTLFFSDAMVNAYAAGCAVHVISSQIQYVLGYKVKQYYGPFKLFFV